MLQQHKIDRKSRQFVKRAVRTGVEYGGMGGNVQSGGRRRIDLGRERRRGDTGSRCERNASFQKSGCVSRTASTSSSATTWAISVEERRNASDDTMVPIVDRRRILSRWGDDGKVSDESILVWIGSVERVVVRCVLFLSLIFHQSFLMILTNPL